MADDPFSQAYDAIWAMLLTNESLSALVKPGNRIKLTAASPHPYKENVSIADLPEISMEPAGGLFKPVASSTGAMAIQHYDIQLAGQDLSIKKKFFAVKWAVMQALAKQSLNLGLDFVRAVTVEAGEDEILEVEKNLVWAYKFTIVVEMWWQRSSF